MDVKRHTRIHTHTHAHIYIQTHAHTLAHTYTTLIHTHTHTHTLSLSLSLTLSHSLTHSLRRSPLLPRSNKNKTCVMLLTVRGYWCDSRLLSGSPATGRRLCQPQGLRHPAVRSPISPSSTSIVVQQRSRDTKKSARHEVSHTVFIRFCFVLFVLFCFCFC